jgi:hypothetical protein
MSYFDLYNLLVLPLVFLVGWGAHRFWLDIKPHVILKLGLSKLTYGKVEDRRAGVKDLGREYGQQPLRKRFQKQRDKGLN